MMWRITGAAPPSWRIEARAARADRGWSVIDSGVGPPRDVAAGAEHRLGEGRSRAPGVAVVVFDEAGCTDVGDERGLACRVDEPIAVGAEHRGRHVDVADP